MKTIYLSLIAVVMMLFASCSNNKNVEPQENHEKEEHVEEVELTQEQMSTVGITLGQVVNKKLGSAIRANGELRLNPQSKADVTSLIGGIIRKINVVEGQTVSAGQVLAYVENTEIVEMQKNYLIAAKERQTALQELQRQQKLSAQGAGIEKTLQLAEATLATAQARMTGLYHQLVQVGISPSQVSKGKIVLQVPVRASISGVINKVNVNTGAYVDTSSPMMEIANNTAVYASLNVFERNIKQVKIGQSVDFVITNSPETHIKAKVYQINPTIDPKTKAISVHAKIMDSESKLIEGMYITGLIYTGRNEVTALPDDAIVSAEGKKYVFVLDEQKKEGKETTYHFKRAEVIVGVSELGFTQVDFVHPEEAKRKIVISNAFYLASMAADHGEH